jgi:hypothetical protein
MNRIIIFLLLIVSSSLYAQQYDLKDTYIPYRKGKLWGLADTAGNIVVEPKYDTIEYLNRIYDNWNPNHESLFIATKDGKRGVITPNGVIVPPTHSKTQVNYPFIIGQDIGENMFFSIYNMKGELFFEKRLSHFRKIKGLSEYKLFLVATADKLVEKSKYQLFDLYGYNDKTKELELLLENILNTQSEYRQKRIRIKINADYPNNPTWIKYDMTRENGQIKLIPTMPTALNEEEQQVAKAPPSPDEEVASAPMPKYEENSIPPHSSNTKRKKEKGEYSYKIKEVGKVKILFSNGDLLKQTKDKRRCFEIRELEINEKGQRYNTEYFFKRNDTTYHAPNYVIIQQKEKRKQQPMLLGIVTPQGTISPQFESVKGYYDNYFKQPFFIVSKRNDEIQKMEYGVIYADETWLFPLQSDFEITGDYDFKYQYFGIKKEGKIGLATREFHPILKPKYDTIKAYKDGIYQVSIDGKYGVRVIRDYRYKNLEMPVIFTDIPTAPLLFQNNIVVWQMENEQGEFLGYAAPSGRLYYKD